MRKRVPVVFAFLATACLAAVGLAANTKVVANFISSAGSGVSGEATLNALPKGGVMIHGKVSGLTADTEYTLQSYTDANCGTGAGTEITRFRANPQGEAHFNAKTTQNLTDMGSLSVRLGSDQSLKACATVPAE